MIVCLCKAVTEKQLVECIGSGKRQLAEIQGACGAGGDCGSCVYRISSIIEQVQRSAAGKSTRRNK